MKESRPNSINILPEKIALTALLLIIPFVLTACTLQDLPVIGKWFAPKETNKQVTLTVWGLFESTDVMESVFSKFREKYPNVTINYEDRSLMNLNDYRETVSSRASQSNAPDLVYVHNSWLPQMRSLMVEAPEKLLDGSTFNSNYYPAAAQDAVVSGKVYAVPVYYDGLALVYNKKHFEAVDQSSAPTSWEEFRGLASRLKVEQEGVLVRGGAALGTMNNIDFSSDILGMILAQAGVSVPEQIDSADAQDAFTFYTNFVREDKVWDPSFPEASVAFSQEKVSMIFVPSWNLLDIIRTNPGLDIGVAPVPQLFAEKPVTWGSFWMMSVPTGGQNKDMAWELAKFISSEEGQMIMHSEAAKIRKYGAPYAYAPISSQLNTNEYLKAYLDTAPYSKVNMFAGRSGNGMYVDALKAAVDEYLFGDTKYPTARSITLIVQDLKSNLRK